MGSMIKAAPLQPIAYTYGTVKYNLNNELLNVIKQY